MECDSKTRMKTHQKFLNIAQELAKFSDVPRVNIGAVVVTRKTIISSGFNQMKSHPRQKELNKLRPVYKHDCSAVHAEMNALAKMRKVPSGAVLYISRHDRQGHDAICRPCPACMSVIKEKGIRTIVYNTNEGFIEEHING